MRTAPQRVFRAPLLLMAGFAVLLTSCGAPVTVVPVPRSEDWWQQRFHAMNERVSQGGVDLVFIGDSITQGWEGAGAAVWEQYYADRNAVNLGIGGDQTQHVLWRLEDGNVDGISPKVAVVHIGTNNFGRPAGEIASGVAAIVKTLRQRLPDTRILLLAIFPRADVAEEYRHRLEAASLLYSVLDCDPMVDYMDIGGVFLDAEGVLQQGIMPDLLHLSEEGYRRWAAAIEPRIAEIVAERAAPQ